MISIILILFIPYLINIGNFRLLLYDPSFYHDEFQKVLSYERQPDAEKLLGNLLQFIKGREALSSDFNEREVSHMHDVRAVIRGFLYVMYAMLILYIILLWIMIKRFKVSIEKIMYLNAGGGVLTILLLLFLYIATLNFSIVFDRFHTVFFNAESWVFPAQSLLIQLFPQQFFLDFTYTIVIRSMVSALFLMIVGVLTYIYFNSYVQKSHS